jgi:transmembrane sensor
METRDNPRRRLEAKSITEQAAEWLMILEDQGETANAAFSDWLRESPTHVQAYLRAATLDTMVKRVDPERSIEIARPEPGSVIADIGPEPSEALFTPSSPRARRRIVWRLAAGVAALGLLAASWFAFEEVKGNERFYKTDVGEQLSVALQDGSTITLNTDSRIEVDYAEARRELRLLKGEAVFKVERDPSRPFRVVSGSAVIQAVGTEFNVYRGSDRTTVSVLEGRVAVQDAPDASQVYLDAGEELKIGEREPAKTKGKANLEKVTAWRQRRLVFIDEPLSAIGHELNRYNRAPKIRVEGAAGERRYAVSLDANDPESLVAVLSGDHRIAVEQKDGEIIVRER